MNNFVAKHAHKFNRAVTMVDRKKHIKQTGYDETWYGLGEFERETIYGYYERGDSQGLHAYLMCVLNLTSGQIHEILQSLREGGSV
jgi:hypothetical protein|tara:strand:+ start:407 stop:664 length:258 start_codon:yes stop_codon:yes gene_type:complete